MKSLMKSLHLKNKLVNQSKARGSMTSATSTSGMSLVEVVVALALLVVIMFFLSSTQLNALKTNHKTGIIRELTHIAEREMESRRQTPEASTVISSFIPSPECFFDTGDYSCTTQIHPCTVIGNNISCIDTTMGNFPASEAVAHQIVVDVVGPEQRSIRLQTLLMSTD